MNIQKLNKIIFFSLFAFFFFVISDSIFCESFYWENPIKISTGDSRFPRAVAYENTSCIFWQEIDTQKEQIWISSQYLLQDGKWETNRRFAGPFSYSGEVPDIYSATITKKGTIAVAALSSANDISIYISSDGGKSFTVSKISQQDSPFVAPYIYAKDKDSFILFTSIGQNDSFYIRYATSKDGLEWTGFSNFTPANKLQNPFIPVFESSSQGYFVVFQAQYITGNRVSYQLYETFSSDNGESWSDAILLTDETSISSTDTQIFSSYTNQRPYLFTIGDKTYVSWERNYYASDNSSIWISQITKNGFVKGTTEQISNAGTANRGVLFSYNNLLSVVWFDKRSGVETVNMAQKNGALWQESRLSQGLTPSLFAFPIVYTKDKQEHLSFIWQENVGKNTYNISRLEVDKSVSKPRITPVTFVDGKRSNAERVKFRLTMPQDSSGIAGYSWSWSKDETLEPSDIVMNFPTETTLETVASSEGQWYLKVKVQDYAGNWSEVSSIKYYLDLTPPNAPNLIMPQQDKFGFIEANTFNIKWEKNEIDDDVEGYTWNLQYLAPVEKALTKSSRHPLKLNDDTVTKKVESFMKEHSDDIKKADKPPRRILGKDSSVSYTNYKNGLYAFSVSAIDTVGNIGEPTVALLLLNKYEPSTYISSVDMTQDMLGNIQLDIVGGGFTYDGVVNTIYIDKDGKSPYDLTLKLTDDAFKVSSDNYITNVKVGNLLKQGSYRIGLLHPDRGLFMSGQVFRVEENGTIKIEKQYTFNPSWTPVEKTWRYKIQMGSLLLWVVILLALAGFVFAIYGLVQTAKDTAIVKLEIKALLLGEIMPEEKKKKIVQQVRRKGIGIKFKLVMFTSLLVLVIVMLVSIPLRNNMIQRQEQTLSKGLYGRINMLLESLASSTSIYMPTQNELELGYLPSQMSALNEAKFITITGYSSNSANTGLGYVWATNDKNISDKISTETLTPGISEITDENILEVAKNCYLINDEAVKETGTMASDIVELNAESIPLTLRTDAKSVARREEIAQITTQLSTKLKTTLNNISLNSVSSIPEYSSEQLDVTNTNYLFYRPVLYRQGNSQEYVRAIVFVEVSTENLIKEVDDARRSIILMVIIIEGLAVLAGAVGAFILASMIVSPIYKLVEHVKVIGSTNDKMKLAGKDLKIKWHDEIGLLGESVNEMTHGLVRAAQDEKLLMDGKVVQQTFLPLSISDEGLKETVAKLNENNMQCFGYYEGASGVSGDYFDYKKLDDRWYVLIKCDASGHGVPAALLMTIVATLFRKYFENWSYEKNGTSINIIVTQINDFIESLGIKGKFATIIICLFDTSNGDVFMCNAGDNIVHIYDSVSQKEKVLTLVETPAAGPLHSSLVDMKGGFKVEKTRLQKGDVLFLYTDGIEESTRKFRSSSFNVIQCSEHGLQKGELHESHKVGDDSEQLEANRVTQIIEAVFTKKQFVLTKYHNPVPSEELIFDFSKCDGTIEDAIIALVSVEKVFRMYKAPDVTISDTVRVDKKIDVFLKKCFNRYDYYCSSSQESSESQNYIEYTFLREDEQLDDLTLLAVRRP